MPIFADILKVGTVSFVYDNKWCSNWSTYPDPQCLMCLKVEQSLMFNLLAQGTFAGRRINKFMEAKYMK